MARDYLDIGSVPAGEDCEQLGENYNRNRAILECQTFIGQLRRQFGPEPGSAQLRVKGFAHDFGTYHEVVCYFDDEDEKAVEYAYKCEGDMPENWDDEAKLALNL